MKNGCDFKKWTDWEGMVLFRGKRQHEPKHGVQKEGGRGGEAVIVVGDGEK